MNLNIASDTADVIPWQICKGKVCYTTFNNLWASCRFHLLGCFLGGHLSPLTFLLWKGESYGLMRLKAKLFISVSVGDEAEGQQELGKIPFQNASAAL